MINFTGMLSAPEIQQPTVFVATYSDGLGLVRKEIEAANRFTAYAIASRRLPGNLPLTNLRKKKQPRTSPELSLDERVDIKLTKALSGIYTNTDLAARFVMDELREMARAN